MSANRKMSNLSVRNAILEIGARDMQENGFFGVSLRRVASQVGIHPESINHHFGGKRGLLSAIEKHLKDRSALGESEHA